MKKLVNVIGIVLMILGLFGCSNNTVKIGAILPQTGNLSGLGVSMKSGLELAIDELNEQSDIKYELVVADAPTNREVVSAYNALRYRHDIKFFVTAGSAYSMALKPNVIQNDEMLFCVASLPDITAEGVHNIFKIGNSSVDESEAITNYLINDGMNGRVVLFYPSSEYGMPFYSTINSAIDSCMCIVYDENERNFKNNVTLALKEMPSRIVAIGETPALGGIIKTLRTMGYQEDIICNTMFTNSNVITAAGEAAEGVIYVDYDFDGDSPSTQLRNESIRNKYNIDFSSISFLAFSIPYIINLKEDVIDDSIKSTHQKNESDSYRISTIIRNHSTINVAKEYPYTISKNGDVKPSLILKKYEQQQDN